jgi:N-acyl-D-aspartate/D-glutamate deacylase
MLDLIIKNGTVVDGTGADAISADVGIKDGRIVALGLVTQTAKRTIDATGLHVMPGFVDIHTHYDGQASWDETFSPSIYHGVTTVVMGNCGVGFAPVRSGEQDRLIDLMEGVEEIPGSVLSEGLRWNWNTFAEYGQALDDMPHSLNFLTLVPHDSLRLYVMGDRAERGEAATADDLAQMQILLKEALLAGGAGLAVGSTETHRTSKGHSTPAFEVSTLELNALASTLTDLPYRVIQAVSDFASPRGAPEAEKERFDAEYQKLEDMARISGRPLSVTWMDRVNARNQAIWLSEASNSSAAKGITVRLQAAPRGVGVLSGLDTTVNFLQAFPSYAEIAHLDAVNRAAKLREPALRARLLAESPMRLSVAGSSIPPLVDYVIANLDTVSGLFFPLEETNGNVDYEPHPSTSFLYQAKAKGISVREYLLDYLSEGDGSNLMYFPIFNYLTGSLDGVRNMLLHPNVLFSLGDAGAHVGTICDASTTTTMLAHWAVQRTRGETLPLPYVVNLLTQRNAQHMGLTDRGTIQVGQVADINIVNLEKLALPLPKVVRDLPAGGRRVLQKSSGYVATLVAGEAVVEDGEITAARPGRWLKAASA